MQGMIGCYIKNRATDSDLHSSSKVILDKMLSALENNGASHIERYDFNNFSLAILYYDHAPQAFKPLYVTANNKHTFIDGFMRNKRDILADVRDKASHPLSLTEYSGIYNIASFDETNNELIIASDRHGARYLYYYDDDDSYIIAPNPKIIMASGLVKNRDIDYQAIISLLSHDYIMGDRSLVQSIKLFPYASCVTLRNGHKETKQYWNFDTLASEKNTASYDDLIAEATTLIKNAMESYALEGEKIIIPLSGGLDSRTIACFLSDKAQCQALHIDYGFEKRYAERIAKTLHIDLEVYPLDYYQPWQAIDKFILCSSHSIHQFWIYPFLKRKIEQSSGTVVLDGYLMNEAIGGLSTMKNDDFSDINKIFAPLYRAFDFILGPKIRNNYYVDHDAQVASILSNCPSSSDYDKYLYFTILNYGRRFTLLFSVIHQYLCSVGLPILDYDLMDFCLKLPFEAKVNSRLYRDIVITSFPAMARIPWSRNRLPLDSRKDQHRICKVIKEINDYKYKLSRVTNAKIETLPRHNKNRLFRNNIEYRKYFMDIIFDEQTFDKGYISRAGLEYLVRLIDLGKNRFYYLEKVALIELVSRQLGVC